MKAFNVSSKLEKVAAILEQIAIFHCWFVIGPMNIYLSKIRLPMIVLVVGSFIYGLYYRNRFYKKLVSPTFLFGLDKVQKILFIGSMLMMYTTGMVFLPTDLESHWRHFIVIPCTIITCFRICLFALPDFGLFFLSLTYLMTICIFISPFTPGEMFLIGYVNFLFSILMVSLLAQAEQIRQLVGMQTLHMSAIRHEIKTPLQGIIGSTDILCAELDNDKNLSQKSSMIEFLQIIRTSAIYLTEIIEHMVIFAKQLNSEDGVELKLTEFEFLPFLLQIQASASAYPRSKNVRFYFRCDNELPNFIFADSIALQQVLLNLLSNAFKFTDQGSVYFFVRVIKNEVCFECRDTGCGMSKEFLQRLLYQPFSQENSRLEDKPRGLGLGLSLSKLLAQQMGGRIEINSQKNIGTEAILYLPLPANAFAKWNNPSSCPTQYFPENKTDPFSLFRILISPSLRKQELNVSSSSLYRSKSLTPEVYPEEICHLAPLRQDSIDSLRIENVETSLVQPKEEKIETSPTPIKEEADKNIYALVVDDNPINRKVLVRMLRNLGFICKEALSGTIALHIIGTSDEKMDVVLLDMFMPDLDGRETSIQIVDMTKHWKHPPLIVGCSADNSVLTQKGFLEVGVSYFLYKPITHEEVVNLKAHVLLRKGESLPIEGADVSPPIFPPSSPPTSSPPPSQDFCIRKRKQIDEQPGQNDKKKQKIS